MERLSYYELFIDGIDKTGKDLVCAYVDQLSNHRYVVKSRGVISQLAYARLYNRGYCYNVVPQQYAVNVLLSVDPIDWRVRCKLTNEPEIDYLTHANEFHRTASELAKYGHRVLHFNTSVVTPYQIATKIIEYMNKLNKGAQNE